MNRSMMTLVILTAACRPAGYEAPPNQPEPRLGAAAVGTPESPLTSELTREEFIHVALYGADSAPKSVLRAPKNAQASKSGLATLVLREGTGQRTPRNDDTVVIHFVGWDDKGQKFDSSLARGKPDRMRVQQLEPGWREGVQQMVIGEKRRLWIPESLAFGGVLACIPEC
jgi:hypothetical protein